MSAWKFKPKLIPTLSVIILFPALLALGFWQLDRAHQKEALFEQYQHRRVLDPVDLNAASPKDVKDGKLLWRRVTVQGVYEGGPHYLLDNQVLNGTPGYFVYTILRLVPGTSRVLVNRGWLPADPDRGRLPELPTPVGPVSLDGVIKDVPVTGILLGKDVSEDLPGGIIRVQKIDLDTISRRTGYKLLPFIVRLNSKSVSGFVRTWIEPGSGREKHLGYAFQWFLMAAALLVIYVIVNLKKNQEDSA